MLLNKISLFLKTSDNVKNESHNLVSNIGHLYGAADRGLIIIKKDEILAEVSGLLLLLLHFFSFSRCYFAASF